ncbi:CHAT domain-containing protein [Streptomyces sp. NPDC093600]|uniref:CHAT domain-containing protein n=1 Tax=Streptomyces sp. NPDC093600 TaxID=3366047 RepID=UPI0038018D93
MTVEDTAEIILDRVRRVDDDPEALRWFLTGEAAAAADDVRRDAQLPDGNVLLAGVHAIGYYDFCRYLAGEGADTAAFGSAVLCFLDVYQADPERVPPLLLPLLALLAGEPAGADTDPADAYQAGAAILVLYQQRRHPAALPFAAALLRHAVQGFPPGSAEQGTCVSDLGLACLYAFRDGAGHAVLAEAVEHSRAAVAAAPGEREEQARRHGNLGFVLRHWAEATADPATARESVTELRHTMRISEPGDLYHGLHLAQLGSALVTAAVRLEDTTLLPEAVTVLRQALAAEPDDGPPPAGHLADLGTALVVLSLAPGTTTEQHSDGTDPSALFDEGIDLCRRAADAAPNRVERALYLTNLALVLNARILRTGNPDVLDAAHDAARDALAAAPPGHPAHVRALHIRGEVLRSRYVARGGLDDLEAAIDSAREAWDATGPDEPQRVTRGVDLADLLRLHAGAVGGPDALAESVALLRRLADDTPAHSRDRVRVLVKLARALDALGQGTGEAAAAAADEAIRIFRDCLALPDSGGSDEAGIRFALGMALARRTDRPAGKPGAGGPDTDRDARRDDERRDREEGLALARQALALLEPDDPRRSEYLSDYGCLHLEHAAEAGDPAPYAEAVRLLRQAVACTPPGSQAEEATHRSNLGAALIGLASLTADEELLAEGVQAHRDAVRVTAQGDHYRTHRLGNLGDALQQLAQFRSDPRLLEEAVEVLREAARAPGAGRSRNLARLGNALRSLSRFTGDAAPLEEAVHWHRQAVAAARNATEHPTDDQGGARLPALVGLANALVERFRHTHDESLRDEAFTHYREALAAARTPGDRTVVLTDHGYALWGRAVDTADDTLMDTAIGMLREAAATVSARHTGVGGVLTNLGSALMTRVRITGDRSWLAEAVAVLRRAVDESPPTSFERAVVLTNLAEALRVRYEYTGEQADADEAAGLLREAIALEHGVRHGRDLARVNLGVLLHSLALPAHALDQDADPAALAEARDVLEDAVASLDDDHPRRSLALMNLAATCVIAAELADHETGPAARSALDRAVSAAREALARVPDGHADQARTQWLLARAQLRRTLIGEQADLAEATRLASQAAHNPVSPVTVRLLAARVWGDAAAASGRNAEALTAHTYAVGLLPRLAPRSLARTDQEDRLGAGAGLASDAAALALRANDPVAALTLLEQGRGVLLAQGLEARGDLSRLRAADPALADEFERVRDALSVPPPRPAGIRTDLTAPGRRPAEDDTGLPAESRHALARDWDDLLDRIRRIPGLERFLSPPPVPELLTAGAAGPVVVVNVSQYRSDALVVTPDGGIDVVPLPALTPAEAVTRAADFLVAVDDAYTATAAPEALVAMRALSDTLEWLWDAVADPVLDRLGLRTTPIDDEPWTRLWWCPTGWLSFLPLHAAGRTRPGSAESVMDRVVSSYTPTLRALVRARRAPATAATSHPAPLVVTLAETPGANPLPGASHEARLLRELFPGAVELAGAAATVDAVRRELPARPWVHFSCHGVSDPIEPSTSGLILHDGRLTALDAAAQRPDEAVLAVLSACSTAQGGLLLPDESVHLASSFQLAGYPHVISTLWPVADKVATRVTERFYTALADDLARDRPIDPAMALHAPVRALRARFAHAPHLWAAHIHTGP